MAVKLATPQTSATRQKLELHPDRALPVDPDQRAIARTIYAQTKDLPLICMHGHVEAEVFATDQPFADPAQLLIVPDHYVTRMLVSQGMTLPELGVPRLDGGPVETDPRTIWRAFCTNWKLYRGTPSRYWLEHELVEVFGVDLVPSAETADALYDRIASVVADPDFRPLALLDRFNIEVISTTDAASSDLSHHRSLAEQGYGERVLPTFRPDAVACMDRAGWRRSVDALGVAAGIEIGDFAGFLEALRSRRRAFVAAGARASDHGHDLADTTPMDGHAAERLFARALAGEQVSLEEARAFAAHMLFEFAGMSVEDGLVMQLHPGVLRNHHDGMFAQHGLDKGFDIPHAVEYTRALRPLLQAYGTDPRFRMILFTIDETVYTRELAPMAGVYPAVKLGAPWWFIDSPEGMRRFRETATETAGFYNTSGFVDDTRAYASIPARHDLFRRIDAGFLARLVLEHRLGEDEAVETAQDLAYHLPKAAYARRDQI
ncbi:glucuronate isomerase [Raineyella fluvialis]|uniref:Uronate isomerase n=1 Tax=Raineyella fluvialis TaxID=2662261 RepID=A0A5Q2F857_9ACTN|nr:glucuronate isomerase [Raineyella fluvialis]QGF23150.1 glucuronate isomerase [Raineyella fluvialis]